MPSALAFRRPVSSIVAVVAVAVLCGAVEPLLAQTIRPGRPAPGTGATRARTTSIQGGAWSADNTPIPHANLRLRNVVTGKIEATAVADEHGQFVFNGIPEGTYLVELVTPAGKVLTVGHTFVVAPGETVATFVRLGPKVPWFNGFFGNAALAVAASAATAGVLALSPESVPSVSPNR